VPAMIEVEGLRKRYRTRRGPVEAVAGIDLRVEAGEFVGYAGPNGAGKSTTVKIMSGILLPSAGRVVVDGLVPYQERKRLARRIGVVFGQRSQLWWDLPLSDSFDLVRYLYRMPAATWRRRLDELAGLLDLGPLLPQPVRTLSLGQRMRAELAAAVLPAPRVLFLDEPTIGLDIEAKAAVRGFLEDDVVPALDGPKRFHARVAANVLAIVGREQLPRVLGFMLDEAEFLSPYGVRAVSRYHKDHPYALHLDGMEHRVDYEPAESASGLFGGNSNWRGPVWFPVNYLLVESLQKFHHFYGNTLKVPCPTGSETALNLWQVAAELSRRLTRIFLRDADGRRPVYGGAETFQRDPHWRDLVLFYEYFHGDNGAGIGASHQTGWTGLVAKLLQQSGER